MAPYDENDSGDEDSPDSGNSLTHKLDEWAKQDVVEMYCSNNMTGYLEEKIEGRRPGNYYPTAWRKECYDYLVESYVYWRRNVELVDLHKCRAKAYRDTFEMMYSKLTPRVKTLMQLQRRW